MRDSEREAGAAEGGGAQHGAWGPRSLAAPPPLARPHCPPPRAGRSQDHALCPGHGPRPANRRGGGAGGKGGQRAFFAGDNGRQRQQRGAPATPDPTHTLSLV